MKYLKMLGLAAVSAMALMAFASSASATTLEVGGVTENEAIMITASLKPSTTLRTRDTFFVDLSTCSGSHLAGSTSSPYTGTTVTGPGKEVTYSGCSEARTVHQAGQVYVEHVTGTTNGLVFSENAEVTTYSTVLNEYINCKTGTGTFVGTLTGVKEGHAEMHINASGTCVRQTGGHLTVRSEGTYTVTSPTGLSISA